MIASLTLTIGIATKTELLGERVNPLVNVSILIAQIKRVCTSVVESIKTQLVRHELHILDTKTKVLNRSLYIVIRVRVRIL